MTVKELTNELSKYPDNMDVYLRKQSAFVDGLVNEVSIEDITFSEEPNREPLSREKVVMIEDI